ncbi:MAG: hypothetical protein HZA50_03550 [Planctomycetes bacterium]|nr:hypothetical protein [Planctomycetota bacterium]
MSRFAILFALLAAATAAAAQSPARPPVDDSPTIASKYLAGAVNDSAKVEETLIALKALQDKDLMPLWIALTRSGNRNLRMLGVITAGQTPTPECGPVLWERVKSETERTIRAEALVQMINGKLISNQQLVEALQIDDNNIKCIAAKALVLAGQGQTAEPILRKLADLPIPTAIDRTNEDDNKVVSCMARMTLFGMGDKDQIGKLRDILLNPSTKPEILTLILDQISEQKITGAAQVADYIARGEFPDWLRVKAYITYSQVGSSPAQTLLQAMQASQLVRFRVSLLETLSNMPDAKPQMEELAKDKDQIIQLLARFDLSRPAGGKAAADAAWEALSLGHLIVIDYVLDKIEKDVTQLGAKADYYTPTLLKYVNSIAPTTEMTKEHIRVANATTILANLGTPAALAGLKKNLSENISTKVRAVSAGIIHAQNPAVCDIIRPLLASPHEGLAVDAALALGKYGDKAIEDVFHPILIRPHRYRPEQVAAASWYIIKAYKQQEQALKAVIQQIK